MFTKNGHEMFDVGNLHPNVELIHLLETGVCKQGELPVIFSEAKI